MVSTIFRFNLAGYIRRISVEDSISLADLSQKICKVYELPPSTSIELRYAQNSNLSSEIRSDSDLKTARSLFPLLLTLDIHIPQENLDHFLHSQLSREPAKSTAYRWEISCSICEIPIVGTRYRCINCSSFNVCKSCLNYGVHDAKHNFTELENDSFFLNPAAAVKLMISPAKDKVLELKQESEKKASELWGKTVEQKRQLQKWSSESFLKLKEGSIQGVGKLKESAQQAQGKISSWFGNVWTATASLSSSLHMKPIDDSQTLPNSNSSSSINPQEKDLSSLNPEDKASSTSKSSSSLNPQEKSSTTPQSEEQSASNL